MECDDCAPSKVLNAMDHMRKLVKEFFAPQNGEATVLQRHLDNLRSRPSNVPASNETFLSSALHRLWQNNFKAVKFGTTWAHWTDVERGTKRGECLEKIAANVEGTLKNAGLSLLNGFKERFPDFDVLWGMHLFSGTTMDEDEQRVEERVKQLDKIAKAEFPDVQNFPEQIKVVRRDLRRLQLACIASGYEKVDERDEVQSEQSLRVPNSEQDRKGGELDPTGGWVQLLLARCQQEGGAVGYTFQPFPCILPQLVL
jgi:hypothetical protein